MHKLTARFLLILTLLGVFGPLGDTVAQTSPTTVQTQEQRALCILTVDDSHYPRVAIDANVISLTGLQDVSLTQQNIRIGNVRADVQSVQVLTQPIRLVVAIDVSVSAVNSKRYLDGVKQTMRPFVQGKPADDEIAILTFNREVKPIEDFTSDKATLTRAIDGLEAETNITALNEVVLQALDKTRDCVGRCGIIVITESGQVGDLSKKPELSSDRVLQAIQQTQVPVRIFSVGQILEPRYPNTLTDLMDKVGARGLTIQTLSDFAAAVRRVYRIDIKAHAQADGKLHPFTLSVVDPLDASRSVVPATANLKARQTLLRPTPRGIVSMQPITDSVVLGVDVASPADISDVTYALGGRELHRATEPPFIFQFTPNAESPSGPQILTMTVRDVVGNVGTVTRTVILPRPPQFVAALPSVIQLGRVNLITVTNAGPDDMKDVVLLVNDAPVATVVTRTGQSFVFAFEPSPAASPAGNYAIGFRATGITDKQSTSRNQAVVFVQPGPPWWLIPLLGLLIGILVLAIITTLLLGWLQARRWQTIHFVVRNTGNAPARFALFATDGSSETDGEITRHARYSFAAQKGTLDSIVDAQASRRVALTPYIAPNDEVRLVMQLQHKSLLRRRHIPVPVQVKTYPLGHYDAPNSGGIRHSQPVVVQC